MAASFVGRLMRDIKRRVEVYGVVEVKAEIVRLERFRDASEDAVRDAIRLGQLRGDFVVRTDDDGREQIRRQVVLEEIL